MFKERFVTMWELVKTWYMRSSYFPIANIQDDPRFSDIEWSVPFMKMLYGVVLIIIMHGMLWGRDYTVIQYLLLLITPRYVYPYKQPSMKGMKGFLWLYIILPIFAYILW